MTTLELAAHIADMKETEYKTNLLLASLIELLIDRKIITKAQLTSKAQLIDLLDELEASADLAKL